METSAEEESAPLRQNIRGSLSCSSDHGDKDAQNFAPPKTVGIVPTVHNCQSSHEQNAGLGGAAAATPAYTALPSSAIANTNHHNEGAVEASTAHPTTLTLQLSPVAAAAAPPSPKTGSATTLSALKGKEHRSPPTDGVLRSERVTAMKSTAATKSAGCETADAPNSSLFLPPQPLPLPSVPKNSAASWCTPSTSHGGDEGSQPALGETHGARSSPAEPLPTTAETAETHATPTRCGESSDDVAVAVSFTASRRTKREQPPESPPAASENKFKRTTAVAARPHQKPSHTAVRRAQHSAATPIKQKPKKATITAAQIAELLTAAGGTPSKTATPDKANKTNTSSSPPPIYALDLPLGLLVLYCAAEDVCSATESVAAPSPAPAHPTTTAAYSLLYLLEQLSDMRRRDRRRAALRQANATEEAKCKELFEAAATQRSANAARHAAHVQEVEAAEREQCTFHPEVSRVAQSISGKGTKDFMAKCLEWQQEAERRLKHKYERQAELEAKQAVAAAAQSGMAAPGEFMTERSQRLLETPSAQERLKARPSLWEAKKPTAETTACDSRALTAHLVRAPIGSKMEEEQEAVLHCLRNPDVSGQETSLLDTSDLQRGDKKKGDTVKQFLSRVEEDAARRASVAARLVFRYHNPEMERYEVGTGQQLFTPNAMPTAWKDGRRVNYEDLTEEEQQDFRAVLRKAGLDFVLTRYSRDQKGRSVRHDGGEGDGADESTRARDASSNPPGGALTRAQQERFVASLQEALKSREKNLQRVREQATAEETFHPRITPRSIRMARHKNGSKPIYERSTIARDVAAVPAKSPSKETDTEAKRSLDTSLKGKPLPEAAELFLARNEQWSEARQRRLERLTAMEEEKRYGDCTFSPNRNFDDTEHSPLQFSDAADEGRAHEPHPLDSSREGSRQAGHRSTHTRHHHDELATAADVRLMNELELLRSGAAFRDERFVQAVCDSTGVSDRRQAMAKLSLQSAPRLSSSGSRVGTSTAPHRGNATDSVRSPSRQFSPIAKRSLRPSASPYAVPTRLGPRREASLPSAYESQHSVPMMRTESGATQTPTHRHSYADNLRSSQSPQLLSKANARKSLEELPPVEDPWTALDAQTDAILKRHGY
ncbi:hypothetical protein ABB37_01352 [Leptomonas pyrrhocoris]|uniref:Uncharacterized protein n=1 Tax=Leptomonas pyrrhocoris TaxID=157538 RepID=A0A0M9G8V9_LEPPY|nr:hypothetical protein ABB37_01352 [Leptomonas pyrrhocoris]XP_015663339.1 hypothetical protein ABB37_01352 [Leptomonas pyrrhocoris]KPA84899.1 hypothetical protein ABB37_01352 [Leptomonas pyrrhocoris]KPA84900.1 hypothetical protein ABB37_01352 [Leptomonas pyrrhocoris]|eukprot:XP_015663338.1 hypothetical protein ABB37_01352 [Leptomonas pyrrhocoris]